MLLHLQNLQHPQSSECSLLDAADVVFIQLTEQKHSSNKLFPMELTIRPLLETQTVLMKQDNLTLLMMLEHLTPRSRSEKKNYAQIFQLSGASEGPSWNCLDYIFTQIPKNKKRTLRKV